MRNYKLDGCFVDEDKKFALIHIYKNASISMRNALGMRGKYYNYDDIKDLDITTICIIRNPMKRIVSSYQYLLRLEDNGFINKHPVHITKETDFFKEQENIIKSFLLFLDYIEEHGFYDAVTLPQTTFLLDRGLTINEIDEVMIQERLDKDFDLFKSKYGIDVEINSDNTSDGEVSKMINEYIDNNMDLQKRIIKLYEEDFTLYEKLKSDE
jgi:hypothetical protein